MSKTCSKCGETKPLEEFHKSPSGADGYRGYCKECQKEKAKAYYKANKERHAASGKAWYEANKERRAAAARAWHEANPDAVKTYRERNRERWPEKVSARLVVRHATAAGTLVKQPCEVCGALEVHGHHDDYSQPLTVRWLCPLHHTEHHTEHHTKIREAS